MARPLPVNDLIPDLEFWIKHPTDPSLRKLLRKTVQTLQALIELVGEPELKVGVHTFEPPPLTEKIKAAE